MWQRWFATQQFNGWRQWLPLTSPLVSNDLFHSPSILWPLLSTLLNNPLSPRNFTLSLLFSLIVSPFFSLFSSVLPRTRVFYSARAHAKTGTTGLCYSDAREIRRYKISTSFFSPHFFPLSFSSFIPDHHIIYNTH